MLLALITLLAAAPDDAFVVASSVRIRASADAKAASLGEVPIATACKRLGEPSAQGWVQLTCGELTGFTKAELLSPTAPDFAKLLADSKDASKTANDRYTALQRAAALGEVQKIRGAAREKLLEPWRTLFFAAEYEHLQTARANKKTSKRVITGPSCGLGSTVASRGCSLTGEYPAADWVFVEDFARVTKSNSSFTGDFIGVVLGADGTLTVLGGSYRERYSQCPDCSEGQSDRTLTIETSYTVTPEPLSLRSLLAGHSGGETPHGCAEHMYLGEVANDARWQHRATPCVLECARTCNTCSKECGNDLQCIGTCSKACNGKCPP